jgi:hypothetical protein
MIIVQFTCELLCAIPVREISVAARLARPGRSAELFETIASAGGREVARATHLARSQDRRRPGDLPAPRSRRGRRMPSAPPRPGRADGYPSPIDWGGCGKLHRHSPLLSVTLPMDETSRHAFVGSGVTGLLEAP